MPSYQQPGSQNPTGGLNLEPVGGQNSLDQFIRSIEGLTGSQGQTSFNAGQQTLQSGENALAPVISQLTKLVKGDTADTDQALAPQINQIQGQFDAARNIVSAGPRG